jgi:hypothetical protein
MLDVCQLHVECELLDALLTDGVFPPFLFEHLAQLEEVVFGDAAEDLALLGFDELGDRLIRRFAEDLAGLETAVGTGDDLLAARVGIATSGVEYAQVSHYSMADDILWHQTTGWGPGFGQAMRDAELQPLAAS